MITRKIFLTLFFILHAFYSLPTLPLREHFQQIGYVEMQNDLHDRSSFDSLYASFDTLIEFLQTNPKWSQKLYAAKERFIRSKDQKYYSSDFFGFYDESLARSQIAFYYSTHFHDFITTHYPECTQITPLIQFLDECRAIQMPYASLFDSVATELGLESIFVSEYLKPPLLFKVIKYLPSYNATHPHYDGTAFSLFLDSTNNESLLLSTYKSTMTVEDFNAATRTLPNSILLIPGALLTEFSIYPTPHIVISSTKTRYAAIAFAMRPQYATKKNELSLLPNFKH